MTRLETRFQQGLHRLQDGHQAGLVVPGATAPHEAILDLAAKRRSRPLRLGAGRHGHHVLVGHQRDGLGLRVAAWPGEEQGVAAHWIYKSRGKQASALIAQQANARWLQSLIDIQDETRDANEFLEHVKIDLFPDSIYVFTPKSKIMALPKGATPVDFAYAIHSDVGDHCVAAKVNGEAVTLRTELRSGDVVEVVTAPGARPNPAWLHHVRTGRARSKIRNYLKNLEQEEARDLGEKMLGQALRAGGSRAHSAVRR